MEYPKVLDNDEALHPELTWRDFNMHNMHIQHDKMLYLKDVIDVMDAHRFVDDFCNLPDVTYIWDLIQSPGNSGIETVACVADEVNGVLELVTEGDDDDTGELVQQCECWRLDNCYPLYAELRFKLDDALNSDFWFGLILGAVGFFVGPPNDYVVFKKDDDNNNLDFANATNTVGNDTDTGIDLVDDTWYRIAFHWDGDGTIRWWVIQDGDFPQTILATGTVTTHIVQDEELTIGFGVRAGEIGAKTLSVDYLKIAQKRVIGDVVE